MSDFVTQHSNRPDFVTQYPTLHGSLEHPILPCQQNNKNDKMLDGLSNLCFFILTREKRFKREDEKRAKTIMEEGKTYVLVR